MGGSAPRRVGAVVVTLTAREPSIGVVMLTYNAAQFLPKSLPPLLAMKPPRRVLVIDSSSRDGSAEMAAKFGAEVFSIPQSDFNHGTTREMARHLIGTDIVVFMTQDAIAVRDDMVSNLVAPIVAGDAAIAYARQVPHDGAGFFERFSREFNYPPTPEIRSARDIEHIGPKTFFCSDSCCAWSNVALNSVGGFRETLTAEDVAAAARLIHAGHKIAYEAGALVKHSHHYSLSQEFRRHFDTGHFRAEHGSLLFGSGGDEKHGAAFTKEMFARLWREHPWKIPYAMLLTASKLAGYYVGYYGRWLPAGWKAHLSSQPYYWRNARIVQNKPTG